MTEALECQVESRVGQGNLLFLCGGDGGGRSEGGTALARQEVGTLRGSCQCLPELFPPVQAVLNTSPR